MPQNNSQRDEKKKSKSITILVIKYKPSLTQHFLEVVESIFLFGSYLSKKHTENQTKINNLQVRLWLKSHLKGGFSSMTALSLWSWLFASRQSDPRFLVTEMKDNLTSHSCWLLDILKPDLMDVNTNNSKFCCLWTEKHLTPHCKPTCSLLVIS